MPSSTCRSATCWQRNGGWVAVTPNGGCVEETLAALHGRRHQEFGWPAP